MSASAKAVLGDGVWCPNCNTYRKFLRIRNAATLADVDRRTIYRYLEEGTIYSIRIAGKTFRVCSGCLVSTQGPDRDRGERRVEPIDS